MIQRTANVGKFRWFLLVGTAIAGSASAQAQQASAPSSEAPSGDIVVTALKRESRVQDTPLSITALSSDRLIKSGATNFNDYYRSVPSLQVTENAAGQNRISLRGVYAPGEASVGVYFDETALTGPAGTTSDAGNQTPNVNLFDVQRVEVLRGPQGTLYGSSSVGGTLRVITNKPDATAIGGKAEGEVATTHDGELSYAVKGAVNLPIINDLLAMRVVGYTQRYGGYIDNIRTGVDNVNRSNTDGGRVELRFTPTRDIKLDLTALYQRNNFDDNSSWYAQLGEYNSDQPLRQRVKDKLQLYSGVLNWNLSFARMTAASSYYNWDLTRVVDATPSLAFAVANTPASSPLCKIFNGTGGASCSTSQLAAYKNYALSTFPVAFYAPLSVDSQTNEVRFSSPGGSFLDWTAGLYYEHRKDATESIIAQGVAASGELTDPLVVNGDRYIHNDTKQFAQFGELTLHPVAGLSITGGARHYHYRKSSVFQVTQTALILGSFAGKQSMIESSADGWVEKVNVAYKISPSILVYGQWSQGFRPGGVNSQPAGVLPSDALRTYQPDKLNSYEAGVKSTWLQGRATLDLSVFQINWTGMQAAVAVPPGFQIVTNAGNAKIDGLEAETFITLTRGLTLTGGLSYIPTAKLTKDQAVVNIALGPQNGIAGDRIPYTAKWSGSTSLEYDWTLRPEFSAYVRMQANYRGKQANNFRPTYIFYETLDDFVEVALRVGVTHGPLSTSLFVNNLFNVTKPVSVQSSSSAPPYQFDRQQITVRPRTIGLNMAVTF